MNNRCGWCGDDPLYVAYHDTEWGVPEYDGRALWEKLVLDGFQAGLSWITILRKRENFREEFDDFDPERVAQWDEARIEKAPCAAPAKEARISAPIDIGSIEGLNMRASKPPTTPAAIIRIRVATISSMMKPRRRQ